MHSVNLSIKGRKPRHNFRISSLHKIIQSAKEDVVETQINFGQRNLVESKLYSWTIEVVHIFGIRRAKPVQFPQHTCSHGIIVLTNGSTTTMEQASPYLSM